MKPKKIGSANLTVVFMLLAAASIVAGSTLRGVYPYAPIAGWGIGLIFLCVSAFTASHVFSSKSDSDGDRST